MIVLKDVEKYVWIGFNKIWLLSDVNLEIKEGEFVIIMGFLGVGKIIFLNIIGMLESVFGGEYYFLDELVYCLKERCCNELYK